MSKYEITGLSVPTEHREEINKKCLYVIENNIDSIPHEYIANAYTGDGGLHGLSFNDYRNYAEFSDAKKEFENGQFFTPYPITQWIVEGLNISDKELVGDLTCGHGAFFNYLPNEENIYGCEIDERAYKVASFLYPNANLKNGSIEHYNPKHKLDCIVGNPPFGLKIGGRTSEMYYLRKASELLKPGGILAVIVPQSFLSDEITHKNMIEEISFQYSFIAQFELSSKTFAGLGVTNYSTKVMFFYKANRHMEYIPYDITKIEDAGDFTSEQLYENFIKPIKEQQEKAKYQLRKITIAMRTDNFETKVTKLLFDIRMGKKTNIHLAKSQELLDKYLYQKRPEGITEKQWVSERIRSSDVLKLMRDILKNQHIIERDEVRLVKTDYGLKRKAYSQKMREILKASTDNYTSFNDMVLNDAYPYADTTYQKLVNRKIKAYELQTSVYADMEKTDNIGGFLDNGFLYDYINEEQLRLNPKQNDDTNLFLQKRYAFAQWSQGTGKTITGIFQFLYRMMKTNVPNTIVLSAAISIKNNWVEVLKEQFRLDYILIENATDFAKIKDGQIILITFDMLEKLKRHMKGFVRKKGKKLFLICDESDALTNPTSVRTLATLSCFRRLKYKLLLTGTATRNNICEFFPQMELMYNNSINMTCECDELYYHGTASVGKGKMYSDIECYSAGFEHDPTLCIMKNEAYYMMPFPPFKKGVELFASCFLPDKITVLGIAQKRQDIYNSEKLKKILDYTMITRSFEEIVGKKIYQLRQKVCEFKMAEVEIYKTALEEFDKLQHLFNMPSNSRKAAALRVLNQLILLLRICAAPQTIPEYDSSVMPGKFERVLEMLEDWKDERVAIGVRHVNVVYAYRDAIMKRFPNRPVIVVTGDTVSLKQRKAIIKELKMLPNAILISTQQSLSCAINIDFIDKCIIPELHYNNSGMSQYYFRFIRYTSKNFKDIYFVTYKNSIEANLTMMILVKEKLNFFMKQNELSDDDIYEEFGITAGMLENLMYKEKNADGKMEIRGGDRWGKQMMAS